MSDFGSARRRRRGRAGKEKQHRSVIQKVAGPRDGELGRTGQPKADGLRLSCRMRRANAQPPWFNVDAAIPEMRVGGGNRDIGGPGNVEVDELVVRSGMGDVDPLVVRP